MFSRYFRQFGLVFFDDILVYSLTLESHIEHLKVVVEILKEIKLFIELSKCEFAQENIEYLGHIISKEEVTADEQKIEAVRRWPTPYNVKSLRGFLGVIEYYKRFVKGYGNISKPLIDYLRKKAFN